MRSRHPPGQRVQVVPRTARRSNVRHGARLDGCPPTAHGVLLASGVPCSRSNVCCSRRGGCPVAPLALIDLRHCLAHTLHTLDEGAYNPQTPTIRLTVWGGSLHGPQGANKEDREPGRQAGEATGAPGPGALAAEAGGMAVVSLRAASTSRRRRCTEFLRSCSARVAPSCRCRSLCNS